MTEKFRRSGAGVEVHALAGVLDSAGLVLEVSDAALESAGIERTDVLGVPFWDCLWWRHSTGAAGEVREAVHRATRGEAVRLETSVSGFGPTPVSLLVELLPTVDDQGRVAHVLFSSCDLVEACSERDQRRDADRHLQYALRDASIGAWSFDVLNGTTTWSEGVLPLYGFDASTPRTFQSWVGRIHADDRGRVAADLEATLASTNTELRQEFRIEHPERGVRWILDIGRVERDCDGRAVQVDGFSVDVTDRKCAELERDRFFRISVDMMTVASLRDGSWKRANAAVMQTLGWSEDELIGMPLLELIHRDDVSRTEEAGATVASGEPIEKFEHRVRCKDGSYKWISWNATPYPREGLMYCIGRDVTAHKQAEDALRDSESRFRAMAECMPHCVWVTDATGLGVYANRVWCTFTGTEPDAARGAAWLEQYHPEDRALLESEWSKALESDGEHDYDIEARIRRYDGAYRWFRIKGAPIKGADAQTLLWVGTCTDIHEQRRLLDALRQSEARYRAVVESQTEMVCRFLLDGTILFVNDAYARTFSTTPEVLINTNFWNIIVEEDRLRVRALLESLSPECPEVQIDNRIETAEGPRWTLWTNRVLAFDESGRATEAQSTGIDITERRRAEEALQQARDELEARVAERTRELQHRAEQLARLTSELNLAEQRERRRLAHVLHDHLQQVLVGAKIHLELYSRQPAADAEAALGVRSLIDEAIAVSRSLTVELAPPILHEAGLAAGFEWLSRWMKEKHGLTVELHADDRARAEREDVRILLFQSVRELLFNVVKHSGVHEARLEVTLPDADHIIVTVSDCGRGFDATKTTPPDSSDRTGFGLFSISERLALLGGSFEVESRPGGGVRCVLVAPANHTAVDSVQPVASPSEPAPVKQKPSCIAQSDVLLVDDHRVVREGLSSLLAADEAFRVIGEAADGYEAIERARALQPDVILMDFSMPRMDGAEATRRIKDELPHVKVIGLSMYEEPDRAAAMLEAGASAYHTKSGDMNALLQTIRDVVALDGDRDVELAAR